MKNTLILGAHGEIARLFLERTDVRLTLYLRKAGRLKLAAPADRVRIVEGDARDENALTAAMAGQDVVYANLSGDLEAQASAVVKAMQKVGLKRLVWISSMGIYDEVPGEKFGRVLDPYRQSAQIIEASNLDYTILRPAWLNNRGRDRLRHHPERRGVRERRTPGLAQERGRPRRQARHHPGPRSPSEPRRPQGMIRPRHSPSARAETVG